MIADVNKFQETKISKLRTMMAEFEDNSRGGYVVNLPKTKYFTPFILYFS